MHEVIDFSLRYGIPIASAIPIILFIFWQFKIKSYLKLNHPDVYRKIYVTEQDERKESEEWSLFSEFISKKYLDLNDQLLAKIIFEYKVFRFTILIVALLFITNLALSHYL